MRGVVQEARRAGPEDIPACAAVINGWIDRTSWFPRVHSKTQIEGFLSEAWPVREVHVIGDPVEGYASVDPEAGNLVALYTARPGNGLGKALMEAAKARRSALFLHAHVPNGAAQQFYRREGFVQVGGSIPPEPPETVAEIRMEWRA